MNLIERLWIAQNVVAVIGLAGFGVWMVARSRQNARG